ncbi:hypothetical protein K438DRAFT_1783073 [Mycena galopus ATCC 62051]|nr:hypothetical protein K438DRAFT_1783073 [Mycena galopus ATCC 62051]
MALRAPLGMGWLRPVVRVKCLMGNQSGLHDLNSAGEIKEKYGVKDIIPVSQNWSSYDQFDQVTGRIYGPRMDTPSKTLRPPSYLPNILEQIDETLPVVPNPYFLPNVLQCPEKDEGEAHSSLGAWHWPLDPAITL